MAEQRDELEYPDIVRRAYQAYRDSVEHSAPWRDEARKAYDMAACKQWDDDDKAEMEEQHRIPTVIDRIGRTLNAIIGTQVNNRQETRYIPRELGDVQVNEMLTGAADWVRDQCDAEDEETDAFHDMCVTGMGWTETHLSYDEDAEGKVLIERRDPLLMFWDRGATKRNLADAKWFLYLPSFSLSEAQARWPDADFLGSASPWDGADEDINRRSHVYPVDAYKQQQLQSSGKKARTIRIAHFEYAERKAMLRVGPQAEMIEDGKTIRKRLDQEGIEYVKHDAWVWKRAFIAGSQVLEEGDAPAPYSSSFKPMTYRRDRNTNLWFGLVRQMTDPQKFGNKFFSLYLDILAKNAKGGVMAEKSAVDDIRKFEEDWAKPDGVAWLNPGAISGNKITNKPAVQFPGGLDRMMIFALDNVHEGTGINLELLGLANRDQPGVLEHQRKQAGITIIAPLFDGLRRYRKEQGRLLLHFIQTYLSDGRLIRITGQGQEKYVPLLRDPQVAKFDVVVDEAPTSPNMKEKVFGTLTELLPHIAKMGIPIPPEILDYAPIPSVLALKWKEMIQQSAGDPRQMQEQLQKLGEENQQLKSKKEESMAKLQLEREEAQIKMAMEREKMQQEMELERVKLANELEIEQIKARNAIEVENMKAGAQMQIAQQQIASEQQRHGQELQMARQKTDAEVEAKLSGTQAGLESAAERIYAKRKKSKRNIRLIRENGELIGADIEDANIKLIRKDGQLVGAEVED